MRIAFLHFWTLRLPRGVETLTLSLANALVEQNAEVSILSARRTCEPLVALSPKVRLKEFPTFGYYESMTIVPFYVSDLIRNKYDVVITFFADFGEARALRLAAPFSQPRHILYLTFPLETAPHRYHEYRRYGWGQTADLLLADAEYTARRGEEFFGRQVTILPSGTDPQRFKPDVIKRAQMRGRLGFKDSDIVLLNVAALEERKGVQRVINILPQVLAECPNIRYLIMGEGSQRKVLEERARESGVIDRVTFGGTTPNLSEYYNAADIFVLLSDGEAGSIALLEAMSSALPVVVSTSGGFSEAVDTNCGRLIDPHDPHAIIQAISELASDISLRSCLGANGRKVVTDRFSWERLAQQLTAMVAQPRETKHILSGNYQSQHS
jgi:glycosyltransferase involved in cell wall biosynthesis